MGSTAALAFVLLTAGVAPVTELKSGPQVGDEIAGGFRVQCANGNYANGGCCPV